MGFDFLDVSFLAVFSLSLGLHGSFGILLGVGFESACVQGVRKGLKEVCHPGYQCL